MTEGISPQFLVNIGGISLVLFALIGVFDGIYFHLIKFKLHLHPQARLEHQIHTLRAFLFGPMVYLIFALNTGGLLLYTGIFFVLLDFVVEAIDVMVEKEARALIGGVSGVEAMVHLAATSMRILALALVLIAKPNEAWFFNGPLFLKGTYPIALTLFAKFFSVGSVLGGMHQLYALLPQRRATIPVKIAVSV